MGLLVPVKREGLKILVGLTMTPVFVKIGMTRAIVFSEIAVFTFMTEATIKQVGSWRKTLRKLRDRDGRG